MKKSPRKFSRIIYSLYIDIPEDELDYQNPHADSTISKTLHTKQEFRNNYEFLKSMHEKYANKIGVEYRLYEYDNSYIEYKSWFNNNYPEITSYNIVNFYKLHILYNLSKEFDEILYLDFDVIPIKYENFFEEWDLSKGIAIMDGTAKSQTDIASEHTSLAMSKYKNNSNRSPLAKYWNTRAMLNVNEEGTGEYTVFNTGIVGANKYHLDQLDYFGDFRNVLNFMTEVKEDPNSMFPEFIQKIFGYDNETIWGYKTLSKEIKWQKLNSKWHQFMDKWSYVEKDSTFVHCIKKDFNYMREYCEKNNI
jgi:hypothetical protein